jgi:cellobiose transport system substrate-binding protein
VSLTRRSLLLGAATAAGLSGCGGGSGEAGSQDEELTFWYWDGALSPAVVKAVTSGFADRATISGTVVDGDFGQRLTTSLKAGSGEPDISGVKGEDMPTFLARADFFLDLNALGAKDIAASFAAAKYTAATTEDGRQIGLPIDLGPTALFLRADLWEKAGLTTRIPAVSARMTDWEGWFEAAGRLRKKLPGSFAIRNSGDVFGVALAQQPETFVTRAGDFAGDGGGVKTAWDLAVRSITEGVQAGIYDQNAFGAALSAGVLTGHLGPAWNGLDLASAAPGTSGHWRVADCPGGPANIGGSYLTLPATCRDPKVAFAFIAELLTPANEAKAFTDASVFPAVTAAYDLPALTEGQKFFGGQATSDIFGPAAKNLPSVYDAPQNAATMTAYLTELSNVEGGKKPATAWKDAVAAGRRTAGVGS